MEEKSTQTVGVGAEKGQQPIRGLVVDFDTEEVVLREPLVPPENKQICSCGRHPRGLVAPLASHESQIEQETAPVVMDRIMSLPLCNRKSRITTASAARIPCRGREHGADPPEDLITINGYKIDFSIPPEKMLGLVANLLLENGRARNFGTLNEERKITVLQNILEDYRKCIEHELCLDRPAPRLYCDKATGTAIPVVDLTLDDDVKLELAESEEEIVIIRTKSADGTSTSPSMVERLQELERALRWTAENDTLENLLFGAETEDVQDREAIESQKNKEAPAPNREDPTVSRKLDNRNEDPIAPNDLQLEESNGVSPMSIPGVDEGIRTIPSRLEAGTDTVLEPDVLPEADVGDHMGQQILSHGAVRNTIRYLDKIRGNIVPNSTGRLDPITISLKGKHNIRDCYVKLTRSNLSLLPATSQPGVVFQKVSLPPFKERLTNDNDLGLFEIDNEENYQEEFVAECLGDTEIEESFESAPPPYVNIVEVEMSMSSSSDSESECAHSSTNAPEPPKKRGRGRPRKLPKSKSLTCPVRSRSESRRKTKRESERSRRPRRDSEETMTLLNSSTRGRRSNAVSVSLRRSERIQSLPRVSLREVWSPLEDEDENCWTPRRLRRRSFCEDTTK